jgi:hypothetical protein
MGGKSCAPGIESHLLEHSSIDREQITEKSDGH